MYYEAHCEKSIKLMGLNVIDCQDLGNGQYEVTDSAGFKNKVTLNRKIVHRGNVYIIMSCSWFFGRVE
jgi:hypothetical protein